MTADKYPSIFSRQMEAIVYLCNTFEWQTKAASERLAEGTPESSPVLRRGHEAVSSIDVFEILKFILTMRLGEHKGN